MKIDILPPAVIVPEEGEGAGPACAEDEVEGDEAGVEGAAEVRQLQQDRDEGHGKHQVQGATHKLNMVVR